MNAWKQKTELYPKKNENFQINHEKLTTFKIYLYKSKHVWLRIIEIYWIDKHKGCRGAKIIYIFRKSWIFKPSEKERFPPPFVILVIQSEIAKHHCHAS